MFLHIDVAHTKLSHEDDLRSLPTLHPDGSITIGDDGEAWLAVNRLLKDSDNLIEVE